mmetsp:Transcript_93125/g.171268  ORF Transcript_93125/g.171268 Transcript_93125/m.171268 type:complete len:201 (+) Transcript_93125:1-603(+)
MRSSFLLGGHALHSEANNCQLQAPPFVKLPAKRTRYLEICCCRQPTLRVLNSPTIEKLAANFSEPSFDCAVVIGSRQRSLVVFCITCGKFARTFLLALFKTALEARKWKGSIRWACSFKDALLLIVRVLARLGLASTIVSTPCQKRGSKKAHFRLSGNEEECAGCSEHETNTESDRMCQGDHDRSNVQKLSGIFLPHNPT